MIQWGAYMSKLLKHSIVILCVCMIVALAAGCGSDTPSNTAPTATESSRMAYTVRLETETGAAVSDVRIVVYEDRTQEELICVGVTNSEGIVAFTDAASEDYVAVIDQDLSGYAIEPCYPLLGEETVITLKERELTQEELENHQYILGDRMMDFTVTDCDGNSHRLYQLLEQKKAVVLNFWYLNCGPCKMEFPYLQQVYEQYGDTVAFLAMNPMDGTDEELRVFQKDNGLTFPMATCDFYWQSLMDLSAYPTTVIVDRDGCISLIHEGMFTDSQTLSIALAYFTSDEYQHQVFRTIEEVPLTNS